MSSRTAERSALDHATRFLLAERDLDDHEADLSRIDQRLGKILGVMVGILVSTTTAAVLLAMNLATGGAG